MKKILFVALVSLVLMLGCIGESEDKGQEVKTEYKEITVYTGQTFEVVVQAESPQTGYDWDFEISDNSVVEYWDHSETECSVGQSSCKETFVFHALEQGTTEIWMMYHIPIASGTIIEEEKITVHVQ